MTNKGLMSRLIGKYRHNRGVGGFFKMNWPHLVQAAVGGLLVLVTVSSVCLQSRLTDIQDKQSRLGMEPMIETQFNMEMSSDSTGLLIRAVYSCRNVGGDTAYGVWSYGRHVILTSKQLYFATHSPAPFSREIGPDGLTGDFTTAESHKLAPGDRITIESSLYAPWVFSLSKKLQGVVLFEVQLTYWDDAPLRRYEDRQYFLIDRHEGINPLHARLSRLDAGVYWRCKIDSLRGLNAVGEVSVLHSEQIVYGWNPTDTPLGQLPAVFSGEEHWIGAARRQTWGWRDTLVLCGDSLHAIGDLRLAVAFGVY